MIPITVKLYLWIVGALVFVYSSKNIFMGGNTLAVGEDNRRSFIVPLILSILLALWMGDRPLVGYGDTSNYNIYYQNLIINGATMDDFSGEWVWTLLQLTCIRFGGDVSAFFTVVALGYMLSAMIAFIKFCPTSPYLGFLFLVSSFMFFPFGVNGIRNGLACHLILMAMAYLMEDRRIVAFFIAFIALGIHRSTLLPIACVIAALTVIRKPLHAFYFWLASIPLSLVAGGTLTSLFIGLGFDDRFANYTTGQYSYEEFSSTGFRWDFLLYSAIPVLMYYVACILHRRRDGWYNIIATTYMLANAFWIIVIRAEFSNRFAYLSWFLYPVMLVYPLCNMKLWDNQNSMAGMILLAYFGFTYIMYNL